MTTKSLAAGGYVPPAGDAFKALAEAHGLPVQEPVWLTWRPGPPGPKGGKPRKIPYRPGSRCTVKARTDTPATWGTLDQVLGDVATVEGAAVGLVMQAGWWCLDIDGCLVVDGGTGRARPWAIPWIAAARAQGHYIERSPSGTGLKIIGRGGEWLNAQILWQGESKSSNIQLIGGNTAGYTTVTLWRPEGSCLPIAWGDPLHAEIDKAAGERMTLDSSTGGVPAPPVEPFVYTRGVQEELDKILEADDWSAGFLRGMRAIGRKYGWSDGQLLGLATAEFLDKAAEHTLGDYARAEYWLWWYGLDGRKGGPLAAGNEARGDGLELLPVLPDVDPDGTPRTADGSVDGGTIYELDFRTPDPTDRAARVTVINKPGLRMDMVNEVLNGLAAVARESRYAVYSRGGEPVVIKRTMRRALLDGMTIAEGSRLIVPLNVTMLGSVASKAVRFVRISGKDMEPRDADMPTELVAAVHGEFGMGSVAPPLVAVMDHATVVDGRLVSAPGYDGASGLFLTAGCLPFERMTTPAAISTLLEPFEEYPFANEGCRSAAVAALMTSVLRPVLDIAPMFLVDAPIQQSGKTLLSRLVSLVGCGAGPSQMSWPSGREGEAEMAKVLLSVLRVAPRVIVFDNAEKRLSSQSLSTTITSPTYEGRVLGVSQTVNVPVKSMFIVNGNNVSLSEDLKKRAVNIRLEPRTDDPGGRRFKRDLPSFVMDNRARLVSAVLSVVLAYREAGLPAVSLRHRGRFKAWEGLVSAPLVWAGLTDPLMEEARGEVTEQAERDAVQAFLEWLAREHPGGLSVADLMKLEDNISRDLLEAMGVSRDGWAVQQALTAGKVLARWRGVPLGGYRLQSEKNRAGAWIWRSERY